MNEIEKLREEVNAIVAAYNPEEDFELVTMRLADIGFRLEDALRRA